MAEGSRASGFHRASDLPDFRRKDRDEGERDEETESDHTGTAEGGKVSDESGRRQGKAGNARKGDTEKADGHLLCENGIAAAGEVENRRQDERIQNGERKHEEAKPCASEKDEQEEMQEEEDSAPNRVGNGKRNHKDNQGFENAEKRIDMIPRMEKVRHRFRTPAFKSSFETLIPKTEPSEPTATEPMMKTIESILKPPEKNKSHISLENRR